MADTMSAPQSTLRWRIPESGRTSLRFALIQIAFASVVVGVMVIFLTPAASQPGLLAATISLALALAAWQVFRSWREANGPANVWLDDAGLHWRDAGGREQMLARSLARRFFVGRDAHTHRDRPSLTLLLEDGFLSQPIELHAPADSATVRQWLVERWSLGESSEVPEAEPVSLPLASEIDTAKLQWRLEGSRPALAKLAAVLREASQLPLPPVGARPRQIELEFEDDFVIVACSPHTWIDLHFFAATPEVLGTLAGKIEDHLASKEISDLDFPLVADTGHHWELRFGVVGDV